MGWQLCHWVSYMLVATCAELHEDLPIWAKMRVTYTAAVTRIHTMLCTAFAAIDWPGLDIDCDVSSCSRAQGMPGLLATAKLVTLAPLSTKRGSPLHAQSVVPCGAGHAFDGNWHKRAAYRELCSQLPCLLSGGWDVEPCHADWDPGRFPSIRVKDSTEVGGSIQQCRVHPVAISLKILRMTTMQMGTGREMENMGSLM